MFHIKMENLKAKGLRRMAVSIRTFKGECRKKVRAELDAVRRRECPEKSYIFFLFFTQNFSGFLLGAINNSILKEENMSQTLKWAVGYPEVLEQMTAMRLPEDDKDIKPSDLVHTEERRQLRFGGEDE